MSGSESDIKRKRLWAIALVVAFVAIVVAIGIFLAYWFTRNPLHEISPPGYPDSLGGPYKHASVASDAGPCSHIGKNILQENGSAVDSAIAAMLCVGVINMHSTGIGGGGFMLVYNRRDRVAEVFDFRESAPAKATEDMFKNASYKELNSTLATGVPGEVRGYYTAWLSYGRLPWKQLVQPAIDKAKYGFLINQALYKTMVQSENDIRKDPGLKELLFDKKGNLRQFGDNITNPQYAKSLEEIRDHPESFYNGSLATKIVRDIRRRGGIVTSQDLRDYKVIRRKALVNQLGDMTWYTAPPPASGPVITLILNILKGYNMTAESRDSPLTFHRVIEAFKFGYSWRSLLGDPAFNDGMNETVAKMTNETFAEILRRKIWDNQTHSNASYYRGNFHFEEDYGTSHLSVLSPNGDAVALTSTINFHFGCKYRSRITGIIYNNEMGDFSTPGQLNPDDIPPSKSNFIKPRKRPQSSISPVIFTDRSGRVRLVAGASGGPLITTAVSLVVVNELWLSRGISSAVDYPRVHHQLFPNTVMIEKPPYTISQNIQDGLRARKHNISEKASFAVVQAVVRDKDEEIYGKSDPRKYGWPDGF
ncbi:gamma-glutamyltranspeptidase 1-like [Orbicella faveolata]|uniref:gamma-glutamyltranspeptidase 1-like n=1 Tax=Orbicella faveolata TaxID=48498 RepID=UPI0009E20AFA|nr:gamma-glutamyltranspeptidase 1-like [Orbicella faveolata]